jgi:histidinol-phosphate aminotransferase
MKFKKIKKLSREKLSLKTRKGFFRLDKNERISDFRNTIFNKIKLSSFDLTAYPETGKVYKSISKFFKIDNKNIIVIPGSEFGYRVCLEYFNNKKKKIISLNPTFGMIEVYSRLFNIQRLDIGYDKNFELKFDLLLKNISSKISLIILANPNSPTGTILEKKKIFKILEKAKKKNIPVLIDEAYNGFYNFSYLKFIKKYKNLLVLRTFSKSFGLAGLRAGFLATNKNMAQELSKYKPMYEINSIACKVVNYLLNNKKISKNYISETIKGKKYFEEELKKLKIPFLKTYANFIHIDLKNKKKAIEKDLLKNKILTRKGPGVKGFESYLRITLGPTKFMKKVILILKKYENYF